ncbi:hypothetical protein MMC21_003344 [Puttea exsequens]|nr:hypothetical protein [Puttea exsequens]
MDSVYASAERPNPSTQDPWDWTVDEVVFALTDAKSPLIASNPPKYFPDSAHLADLLRENDVNGQALLTIVDRQCLKEDFRIKSLSQQASIGDLIRTLQCQSPIYLGKFGDPERRSNIGGVSRIGSSYFGTPLKNSYPAASTAPSLWSPTMAFGVQLSAPNQTLSSVPDVKGGNIAILMPKTPRHHLALAPFQYDARNSLENHPVFAPDDGIALPHNLEPTIDIAKLKEEVIPDPVLSRTGQGSSRYETTVIDKHGRKRRRLVLGPSDGPKLATSCVTTSNLNSMTTNPAKAHPIDSLTSFTASDSTFLQDDDPNTAAGAPETRQLAAARLLEPLSVVVEAGVVTVDAKGHKRLRPVLVSGPNTKSVESSVRIQQAQEDHKASSPLPSLLQPSHNDYAKQRSYGKKALRNADQMYLGLESLGVDEVFYERTEPGKALESGPLTEDFSMTPPDARSSGQQIYVNGLMKYFLRSPRRNIEGEQSRTIGIVPYPDRLGKKHHPLWMTIFSKSSRGIIASRSIRAKWFKENVTRDAVEISNAFGTLDTAHAQEDANDPKWKALEKWKYMEGTDDVLPVYGDSGSEGEYELETWKEMEREAAEQEKRLERADGVSRSTELTSEEVAEAIDTATKQLVQDWTVNKLPKLEPKAWRIWAKSRRDKTAETQIQTLEGKLDSLQSRISNLTKEIAAELWSKPSQLDRQCKILQPSIFDREDDSWRLAILNLKKAPPKPPPAQRKTKSTKFKQPVETLNEDKENIDTDRGNSASSDDSLGSFIVEDVDNDDTAEAIEPLPVDDDQGMADVEDAEDNTDRDLDPTAANDLHNLHEMLKSSQEIVCSTTQNQSSHQVDFIDLTQLSDPVRPPSPIVKQSPSFAIKTPPLESEEDDEAIVSRRRKPPVFKVPPSVSKKSVTINLDTDTAGSTSLEETTDDPSSRRSSLPAFDNIDTISAMNALELVERQDRKRLLIWMIAHAPTPRRNATARYLYGKSMEASYKDVKTALNMLKRDKLQIRGMEREESNSTMQIAVWYVSWTIPVKVDPSGISSGMVTVTLEDEDGYESFYYFLRTCLQDYHITFETAKERTPKTKRERIYREESDEMEEESPLRKRKYVVPECQETLDKRRIAQDRMRKNEERRRQEELKFRFAAVDSNQQSLTAVIVNPGKHQNQDFIHLNPKFGNGLHIKTHQEEGLQFLWREITAEHEDLQGCLLAQTMGLGKTMQVVALLVALADAAKSSNPNIIEQVPPTLRQSRTLVLCPPALVDNWRDELFLWVPKPHEKVVGSVRRIHSAMPLAYRLIEIQAWNDEGGVLLMGYQSFRSLVRNNPYSSKKKGSPRAAPLDEHQHRRVKHILLERPNLVVADEAHEFKNNESALNTAINKIKTRSRIALTASPLNNHLEEYFTIVDWIAPGYLGSRQEFRATYAEPINEGLYKDSTDSEYRQSRKKLKALELEMEPKLHRADASVLVTDLRGKMEFLIKVPLTHIQQTAYNIFVEYMLDAARNQEPRQSTLWSWVGVLKLLCNHPQCYWKKLLDVKSGRNAIAISRAIGKKKSARLGNIDEDLLEADDETICLEEPMTKTALSHIAERSEEVFSIMAENLSSMALSNKIQILMTILSLAETLKDKVLIFSHSLATLDYVGEQIHKLGIEHARIDGSKSVTRRQEMTKNFNEGTVGVCLVSTRAGGLGLNLFGANRVVILDEHFNPMWEQQAIGRAYRIGQQKPVYVYRLTVAGTFEQVLLNQALFKEQLATRVVDKKNPTRRASKTVADYLFPYEAVKQDDLSPFKGKDPHILDELLANPNVNPILSIVPTETFHIEDGIELTAEEGKEAEQMQKDEQLRRRNLLAHSVILNQKHPERHQMNTDSRVRAIQIATRPSQMSTIGNGSVPLFSSTPSHNRTFDVQKGTLAPNSNGSPPLTANGKAAFPSATAHVPKPDGFTADSALNIPNDVSRIQGSISPFSQPYIADGPHDDLHLVTSPLTDHVLSEVLTKMPGEKISSQKASGASPQASEPTIMIYLRAEVTNLFRLAERTSLKVVPDFSKVSGSAQKAAADLFYNVIAGKSRETNSRKLPQKALVLYAGDLAMRITWNALNQTDHDRLVQGVKALLERSDVEPRMVTEVIMRLVPEPDAKPASPQQPKQIATNGDYNMISSQEKAMSRKDNQRDRPVGGMLSDVSDPIYRHDSNKPASLLKTSKSAAMLRNLIAPAN